MDHERLGRSLRTVTWPAGQNEPDLYIRNEHQVNIPETKHFGRLGFVEFGALTVDRIVQRHPLDKPFERGAQKSVFRFGASAVAVFGEAGAWRPPDDILKHTLEGMETIVRLGEPVATSLRAVSEEQREVLRSHPLCSRAPKHVYDRCADASGPSMSPAAPVRHDGPAAHRIASSAPK